MQQPLIRAKKEIHGEKQYTAHPVMQKYQRKKHRRKGEYKVQRQFSLEKGF